MKMGVLFALAGWLLERLLCQKVARIKYLCRGVGVEKLELRGGGEVMDER